MGFYDEELHEELTQVQARLRKDIVDEINNQHNDKNGYKIGLPATIDRIIARFETSLENDISIPNVVNEVNRQTIYDLKRYKEIVVQQEADVE
ncbi:hypothetical protein [Enterococcus casseliflavus]|uniref:hypothetical protein n=1 Tax=Enterococcus TaxID=1350 RepID=UPI001432C5D3|nr:hypothetical protein [Enterococcus casseliflavus]NKD32198.1 hypothetical protein [Enterococcus casseliflavus]